MTKNGPFTASRRALMLGASAILIAAASPNLAMAQAKPKIGFIGAGKMGSALGKLWAEAGYSVMLSARDVGPVQALAAQIGHGAQAGTPEQAAAFGDVVVVTVPYGALPQLGQDYAAQLKGKVVLDTCNPYVNRDGDMAKQALADGAGVTSQKYLPGTHLVRAFNAIAQPLLVANAHRAGEPIGIEIAADDPKALAVAKQLVTDAGFEPVVVGGLASAKLFDNGTPVYPKALTAKEIRTALNLK